MQQVRAHDTQFLIHNLGKSYTSFDNVATYSASKRKCTKSNFLKNNAISSAQRQTI